MRYFRIVKKFYKMGELHELKHEFAVEEMKKSFLTGKLKWKPYMEMVCSWGDCRSEQVTFREFEKAQTFVRNLLAEIPQKEVVDEFIQND